MNGFQIVTEMKKDDKIFLVGFMGCGKSTFGRKIASALNWNFVDLDEYIEEKEGKSISSIFEELGEEYFRKLETSTLEESKKWNKTIISCGGGTPCFNNNAELINNSGLSVYISLSPEMLKNRLIGEKSKRPLIERLSNIELLSFIQNKLSEREEFYNKAKIKFDYSDDKAESFIDYLRSLVT